MAVLIQEIAVISTMIFPTNQDYQTNNLNNSQATTLLYWAKYEPHTKQSAAYP